MKKLFSLFAVLVVFALSFFLWWQREQTAVNRASTKQQTFVITSGAGLKEIAANLQQAGFIHSALVFEVFVKFSSLDGKIQAGNFQLSQNMSMQQIAYILTHGTADIWVTIPEGLRTEEIATIFQEKLSSYSPSWLASLHGHEGYLFPDTYSFPKDTSVDNVISMMTKNFDEKYATAKQQQTVNISENNAVILASIVQREAISQHDMQYVASALENRLALNMALASDVTLEYALGYQTDEKTWWKKELTVNDLQLNTPYNTRLNAGLPPTPISNPGLVALEAVLNPPKSDYLYYVSDKQGILHFAKTLNQHNANVARYE
ncbi:MAG TPA: endolytic transglycosylase MltG [Patescibacteria group bacterium]|nr:endolytic transglycosylase MltG [Patescibacteria group bacterium]